MVCINHLVEFTFLYADTETTNTQLIQITDYTLQCLHSLRVRLNASTSSVVTYLHS